MKKLLLLLLVLPSIMMGQNRADSLFKNFDYGPQQAFVYVPAQDNITQNYLFGAPTVHHPSSMIGTKVMITLSNGKTIPAIKYESDKAGAYPDKAPLIIYLSGRGEQLNTNVTQSGIDAAYNRMLNSSQLNMMANAELYGFKVIVPLFVLEYNGWQPDFTGGTYARDVANWAIANMNIDPLRMSVMGWSSGGNGTFYAGTSSLDIANMWAAIVPIASGGVAKGWQNIKDANLPVWMFHSKDDVAISMGTANDNIKALQALNMLPAPKITIFDSGGHGGAMSNALKSKELFAWLAQQRSDYKPPVVEPPVFKPTHKITRADGTSELIRLEATQ